MLTVRNLMSTELRTVSPEASLRDAVVIMNKTNARQLPVLEKEKLVGIISNRDIRLAINSPLLSTDHVDRIKVLEQHTVAECMTKEPKWVSLDTSIQETAEILALHKIGALPVLENDILVGIITVTDLLNQIAQQPVG